MFFVVILGCEKKSIERVPVQEVNYKVNIFLNNMNKNNYQEIYDNELSEKFRDELSLQEFIDFIGFFHSSLGDYKEFELKASKLKVSNKHEVAYFVKYDVVFNKKPAVVEFVYFPVEIENCNGLCLIHVTFTM